MLLIYFGQDISTGSNDNNKYSISEMGQPLRVYYASITRPLRAITRPLRAITSITRYYVYYVTITLILQGR